MYKVKPQFESLELRGNIDGKLILFKDLKQEEIISLDELILKKYFFCDDDDCPSCKEEKPKKSKKKKNVATNSK